MVVKNHNEVHQISIRKKKNEMHKIDELVACNTIQMVSIPSQKQ